MLRARPEARNPKPCEPCPPVWTACGFGAQAFRSASAFNANIGAWNTAAVTTLSYVCAAAGPGGAHNGGCARPGLDATRPVVRGGTADVRARAHMCGHWLARASKGCSYGCAEGRYMYTTVYLYTYTYI